VESSENSRNAEIFRRATLGWGIAYNPDLMPGPVKASYEDIAARADDLIQSARDAVPGLPVIHFDFIVNGHINVYAFRAADRYFIGMNTGTLYMLRLIIGRMLADPRLFPSIGDPAEEVSDLKPIQNYFPDADRMYMTNDLLAPRNADRRAYAEFLEDQALMFYVGHEITHIAHGHVDYLREKRGLSQYSEISVIGADDAEAKLERQCLEQDADRRSILARISSLREQQTSPDHPGLPWAGGDKTAKRLIGDWIISIGIVFRLFGDKQFNAYQSREAYYPPLPLRRRCAETVAKWGIETGWDATLRTAASEAMHQGRRETDNAFATILDQSATTEEIDESLIKAGTDHLMRLQDYWNSTMVEKLRPYSYAF
jgi:hypothetical protein